VADPDLFIEVADGKSVNRFLVSPKKHEFVIGSGKAADFQIGKRNLKEVHIKLVRNPNTQEWHAQDLSNDLFEIKGSTQKRSMASVAIKQAITVNPKCIIRLNTGKASLSEKLLASKSVGGLGAKEYAVMILAPISIGLTVFMVLQNQPDTAPKKELDSVLKCHAQRTGPALKKYKYGSTYLERVWPDAFYDCVKNAEASCRVAYGEKSEKRDAYRGTYKSLCSFLSETREETDDGKIAIDYYASEYPAKRTIDQYNRRASVSENQSLKPLSENAKQIISEVCFTCNDYSQLNEAQRQSCDEASKTVDDLSRARELWSAGRTNDALAEYRAIKVNSMQSCEAYRAADLKSIIILRTSGSQSR
jgi:hypothetical protein